MILSKNNARVESTPSLPKGPLAQMVRGALYPISGLRFISQQGLWGKAIAPILINALAFMLILILFWYSVLPRVELLDRWGFELLSYSWWVGVWQVLRWATGIVLVILLIGVGALLVLMLGQAVASPFLDILSQAVEKRRLGQVIGPEGVGAVARGVVLATADALWAILLLIVVHLPLFLLGFIAGPFVAVVSFVLSALVLSHEFVSFSLARAFVTYRERWRFVLTHKWLMIGFGSSATVMTLIPGLNLILLPVLAVGGTLLLCDMVGWGWVKEFESRF